MSRLLDRYYYSHPAFLDGTTEFHQLIARHYPGGEILEIGCGPENPTTQFLGSLGRVTGADVTDEAADNRALSRYVQFDGERLPLGGGIFGMCVSNYVLEHVADPERHFREVARVMSTGGRYCLRTPNLRHYVAAASRFLPHSAHVLLANRLRGLREAHEPYPTYYRANTARKLRDAAKQAGLHVQELRMVEKEPSYGHHAVLFWPMMVYERVVNRFEELARFRANIFAVLVKK